MIARVDRELTGPYWTAVDDHHLVRPHCHVCERSHFSPQVVCPHCGSPDWSYVPSRGTGAVVSHTTIHRPPDPRFSPPYVVADIEIDEGWRLLAWIVDCDPEDVAIGLRVEVCFVSGVDGETLPAFRPLAPPRSPGGGS